MPTNSRGEGYLVTFTSGNAPGDDLLCASRAGTQFLIQVKSLRSKTYFLYQKTLLDRKSARFFVFVYIPPNLDQAPEYFVLNRSHFLQVVEAQNKLLKESEAKRGKLYADFSPGINYGTIAKYDFLAAWGNLPA